MVRISLKTRLMRQQDDPVFTSRDIKTKQMFIML